MLDQDLPHDACGIGAIRPFRNQLNSEDSEAWYAFLRDWIESPAAREGSEQKIRASFVWPDWTEAAARMLAAGEA